MKRATTTTLALLAALVSSAFGVEDAGAAGTPIGGIRWALTLEKRLPGRFVQGFGLEFSRGRVYLTGQVRTTKTQLAAAPAR